MSIEMGTRIYNEEYYLDSFIKYNFGIGIDGIHFFDCGSTDASLKIIADWQKKDARVKLVVSNPALRFTTYSKDEELCNQVLEYALEFCRKENEGLPTFLEKHRVQRMIRCVFYDWFLPPDQTRENISADRMLEKAINKELKGRLLPLLNDPFYKDYVLYADKALYTADSEEKISLIYGNHRFIINNTLVIPPNTPILSVNHLRGVSCEVVKNRLGIRLELLQENYDKRNDALSYVHFKKIKQEIDDYDNLYTGLKDFDALIAEQDITNHFDNESSHFNRLISFKYKKMS